MKNRQAASIIEAYNTCHTRLCNAGCRPNLLRLDNECSTAMKANLQDKKVSFQLVPPGIHRRNAAERAIRTFKNHFIAGLCSTDNSFPLHLWDRLLPQAELTLNLLRASRMNPKLSAWAQIHGHYDYNATPLAPPGIRVVAHDKPDKRGTWAPHGEDGYYIGPALESYRCWRVWITKTRQDRICDTLAWFPGPAIQVPYASTNDLILAALNDIKTAIQRPLPADAPAPFSPAAIDVLSDLHNLLHNSPTRPSSDATVALEVKPILKRPSPEPETPSPPPLPARKSSSLPSLKVEPPTTLVFWGAPPP